MSTSAPLHSPTPWWFKPDRDPDYGSIMASTGGPNGRSVFEHVRRDHAEPIIIAMNSHAALVEALGEAWGALNFILAFYDPGQRHLDTEAWKQAEVRGRIVHAKLRTMLDAAGERFLP